MKKSLEKKKPSRRHVQWKPESEHVMFPESTNSQASREVNDPRYSRRPGLLHWCLSDPIVHQRDILGLMQLDPG